MAVQKIWQCQIYRTDFKKQDVSFENNFFVEICYLLLFVLSIIEQLEIKM